MDFEKIYKKYKDDIYNYVFWRIYSEEDALDITQDIFIKIYKGLPKFKGESSLKTWIFAIARNTVINYVTRRRIKEEDIESYFQEKSTYKEVEMKIKLLLAMEKLAIEHREILKLYYFDGFSYKEIAKLLGIKPGTVKSRLNRAKLSLKEKLGGGDIYGR